MEYVNSYVWLMMPQLSNSV